jgi:hypothetical protein
MRRCGMCKKDLYDEDVETFTYGGDVYYVDCECAWKIKEMIENFKVEEER